MPRFQLARHVSLGPDWPDECVVYDASSSRTHIVTSAAMDVLRVLTGPHSVKEVAGRIGIAPDDADSATSVESVLLEFDRLGIVTALPD